MASPHNHDLLAAVQALHARGWALIPVPYQQKRPVRKDWQHLRLTAEELAANFHGPSNVGVLLGESSGGLVDVDLDSPETRLLADRFLPPTGCRFGRASSPDAHWFYCLTDPIGTTRCSDPATLGSGDRGMLVELRSTGAQTLVPPSVHPSGEPIHWTEDGPPSVVPAVDLRQAVTRLAAAALLARHWPAPGSRQQTALALTGGLLRAGWREEDVAHIIGAITYAAGDEEAGDRVRTVASTAQALRAGQHVTGWPTLATAIDLRVIRQVQGWLGVHLDHRERPEPHIADVVEVELVPQSHSRWRSCRRRWPPLSGKGRRHSVSRPTTLPSPCSGSPPA